MVLEIAQALWLHFTEQQCAYTTWKVEKKMITASLLDENIQEVGAREIRPTQF